MKTFFNVLVGLTVSSTLLTLPQTAQAAIFSLASTLSGSQEVPANNSPASGSATLSYDNVINLLSWNIQFSDLQGTSQLSHFHGPAPRGVNGPVQININTTPGFTSPLIGTATLSEIQESQLLSGLWYINIHSSVFPGGEIRGQVELVPESSSLGAIGLTALVLLGFSGRQRDRLD
jgi:hypothetical protein